jgi:glycosyltransferase involved in cell wall biosynthesis
MANNTQSRTLIVSGAYPPDICGVGDYTARLMEAVQPSWQAFVERDWSLRALPGILRRLFALKPAAIVVQYPTQGYGWSLVPHILIVIGWITRRYRSVLALHEFTSLSRKAQIALALASHFSARIIFTTEVERDRARAFKAFSSKVPTSVIGILSNIPCAENQPDFAERSIDVAYFGHIRPNKGLEDFLEVATAMRIAVPQVRIAIIGEIPKGYDAFGGMVMDCCAKIGVTLILGLNDEAVARQLADTKILYLPFKDGVSARRGSVLAGLDNGAIVATRIGDATPASLRPAVVACDGTAEDVAVLCDALAMLPGQAAILQRAGRLYTTQTLPQDWAHVAALYHDAVGQALL